MHSTDRKITVGFAIALGLVIAVGAAACWSVLRLRDDAAWVAHTQEVIGGLGSLLAAVTEVETSARGFAISGDASKEVAFRVAAEHVDPQLQNLRRLTADNAIQQVALLSLGSLIERRVALSASLIEARRNGQFDPGRAREAQVLHDAILSAVSEMEDTERTLLESRQGDTFFAARFAIAIVIAGGVLAAAAVAVSLALMRRDFAGARSAQTALHGANTLLEERIAARTEALRNANEQLASNYRELRQLVEQAPLAIAMFDRDMRYIATSGRWIEQYGRGRSELAGVSHYDVHPDLPERWKDLHRRGLAGEVMKSEEDLWIQADGSKHWLWWAISPWRSASGEIGGITIFAEDVTARRLADDRLHLADAVFRSIQEGVVITEADGKIVAVNPAFSRITEYDEGELVGQNVRLVRSGHHDSSFYRNMWQSILQTGAWQGEIWNRRKSGEFHQQWLGISTVKEEGDGSVKYVGVATDLSRMRHATSYLEYVAHHDILTGLPNRAVLHERLQHSIERARREKTCCAVLFIDLDDFKSVNDQFGHEAGDEVLVAIGRRMASRLRDIDTLARFGGDEFVAVIEQLAGHTDASAIAADLITQATQTVVLSSGGAVRVGATVGISLHSGGDEVTLEDLLREADSALYKAKATARGTWYLHGTGRERHHPSATLVEVKAGDSAVQPVAASVPAPDQK